MTNKHLTDQRFTDLNLIDSLKQGIADSGFEYCTPIQEKSLPIALTGKDVAGQAQTGTGKTVAFLLACCQQLVNNPAPGDRQPTNVRALILAPTRELAIQIYKDAEVLARHTDLKLGLVYGGTGYDEQKQMLAKGADILIGTPGRLIDFFKQKLFDLKLVQVVVLDEADRMFDLGFIKDIRFLLRRMPKPEDRLNMLFSATLSFRVMELAYEHMNNPEEIKIDTEMRIADKIREYSYYPADEEKSTLLINLLRRDNPERVLVFVNTRYAADDVSRTLSANDVSNAAISGDVPQRKRENRLDGFKTGKYQVLVATDVAARGLHIPAVSHVFNFDLPQDADDYVHRIGRTARAGQSGEAISFICEKYAYSIMEIEEYIGHIIPKQEIQAELLSPIKQQAKSNRYDRYNSSPRAKSRKSGSSRKPAQGSGKSGNRQRVTPHTAGKEAENTAANPSTASGISERQADSKHPDKFQREPDIIESVQSEPAKAANNFTDPKSANNVQNEMAENNISVDDTPVRKRADSTPTAPISNVVPAARSVSKNIEEKRADNSKTPDTVEIPKIRFSRRFGEVPFVG